MRAIVLDTETTGLYPHEGHRIIELALLEIRDRMPTGREWRWYFNPKRNVDAGAVAVHGLTRDFLRDKPCFHEVAEDILDIFGDDKLIAHNAPFDIGFLNAEFERLPCYPKISGDRVIDTLALARKKYPGKKNSLDALCKRFKINNSTRDKHSALLDAKLLMLVYFKLNPLEQIGFDMPDSEAQLPEFYGARPEPLESRLTKAEKTKHKKMVKGLEGNPLWDAYE